uniref:Selenoprotein F/M domain-containing protein n=1 Tax=Craspedostauros australis TaxID=1486917 RepID=A0A7R9WN94_9STRA|mmetsp:Transcript_13132/g.36276  ORF Transcript_13132/g.36276 Transcript_13132/m.36276 type:complete len:198 (+) Transcript_13132:303-896(+)|eukprot:CAMPEP_0198116252 /NCGR_PEP_ID=MMETSP1442-20131203/10636_1 /TAXON_ID= /ORGANISM="Craspedostauros australis, Strain CCMP3328" /LENGTH=197 /DNA_ID=CAMNT_0043774023 /DNA_START=191 /DNA_END=784 /DNA_ORIENTATION=+
MASPPSFHLRRWKLLAIVALLCHQAEAFGMGKEIRAKALAVSSTVGEVAEAVNGETYQEIIKDEATLEDAEFLRKRVPVVIRYSAGSGLKPFYLTVAKRIKEEFPDVILDKVILPADTSEHGDDDVSTFEVLIDGKLVVSKYRKSETNSVFVSMSEVELAVTRARRKRRPSTVYGEEGTNLRLEMLKKDRSKNASAD